MAERPKLNRREQRALSAVAESMDQRGYPPSVRELGAAIGLTSTSSVAHVLRSLEWKGYLRREPGRSRAISVLDRTGDADDG